MLVLHLDGDKIIPGRLLRSDNLQALTASDVDQLLGLGLSDVIDLRSDYEAERGGSWSACRLRCSDTPVLTLS